MSTSFINILLLTTLFIAGCATDQARPDKLSQQDVDKALKETSQSDILKYREAITFLAKGNLDEAEARLIEFSEERPELAGPYANLALIHIKRNKLELAEQMLSKALQRNPEMPQAYNLMGYIEKNRGNIIKAKDMYSKAIELKNNYALAHYNLALLYDIYIQDISKAVMHYQTYLALTKNQDKITAEWVNQLKASLTKS